MGTTNREARYEARIDRLERKIERVREAQARFILREDMAELGFGRGETDAVIALIKTGIWDYDQADRYIIGRLVLLEDAA